VEAATAHIPDRDDVKQSSLARAFMVAVGTVHEVRGASTNWHEATNQGLRAAIGPRERARRRATRAFGILVAGATGMAALGGCGLSSMTSGLGNGILGGSSSAVSVTKGVNEEQLLHAAKSDGEVVTGALGSAPGCPQMLIWSREKHLTVYEGGRTGDGLAIVHQGEITKVARECEFGPGQITIKFGFSGRVLMGPRGQPGLVQLPVTAFVTDGNRERVQAESIKVDVTMPPDTPIGYFSTVRTLSFKIQEGARPADYKLFVGFDKAAPEATGQPAPAAAPAAKTGKKKG
jgi:hypothetical protein